MLRALILSAAIVAALAACKPGTDAAVPAAEPAAPADAAAAPVAAAPAPATPAVQAPEAAEAVSQVNQSIEQVLGDPAQYEPAIRAFQSAVAAHDAAAVARMVEYPFAATLDGKQTQIKDAAAFAAAYDRIVTPEIAQVIAKQNYAELAVSGKGVMFGNGEAWINGICRDNACKQVDVRVVAIQAGAAN